MANTTLKALSAIAGSAIVDTDLFLVHGFSANAEYKIAMSDLRIAVGNVQSGSFTVNSSGVGDALVVTSTDALATAAPDIVFYRDSASPAASDFLGKIEFRGKNSVGVDKEYASINTQITSPTSSAETGMITFNTMNAGTSDERVRITSNGNVGIGTTSTPEKLNVTGNIKASQQVAGGYTAHTAGTVAMALATNSVVKVTPTATATFTTTVAPAGSRASVIIVTSGVTSYTITFGTGFLTTGTLATGTVTAKTFVIDFVSDGTTMIETGRTTAM